MEIRPWVVAEIKALSANQSLTVDDIAFRAGQPAKLVRLCLRQEGIRRKPGRKKSVDLPRAGEQAIPRLRPEKGSMSDCRTA